MDARETAGSRDAGEWPHLEEETHLAILNDAPYGLLLADANGTCRYINRTFMKITGYDRQDIPTLAVWFEHAHPNPAYRQQVAGIWQELISRHRSAMVVTAVCRDGKVREIDMRLTPLENEYSLVTILDVTEEKKAEELLRQTTSELSAVIDAFPDLFLRLNADGTIIDYRMGRAAEAPYAPQHLLGRRIQDLLPGQIGPALLDAVQQVLRTETPVIREFTLQPGDGQRHYEIRIVPLYEKYLLAIMREITERVLTEQELQTYRDGLERLVRERTTELERANHQLRRLLYYVEMTERKAAKEWLTCSADPEKEGVYPADEGIVTTDAEGRIILANYAAEQYIGYDSSEMAGKPIWSFCSAGASGDYPLPGFFSDVLEAGRQNAVEDAVLFRKDGAQRPIRLLGEPIRDENDAVIGMICTFHLA